ncbi:hypothetical protein PR202_ga19554 [Eleusine coracana subsp. coracana]|uniref:EF-hand domain-containing protein n=1 Tax=Eleusine coracana subsp. coracana TaxID=191504 RepID=A0AAV5CVW1_ELECO|nr:hypothetical protein PR202_ga19554 [Eleusine coracana subsp. coracana]
MAEEEPMTEYEKQRLLRIRENEARLEALGLRSLAASPLLRNPSPSTASKRKQKGRSADEDESTYRPTTKAERGRVKSRIQLTEDDVIAFFFSFDEVGKGYITPWDLERMATINDFIWTDSEMSNMIRCFDSDGDGKINLEDFRNIVSRCNMLQEQK